MDNQGEQPGLEQRVLQALNVIRPYLEADGGDVRLVEIKNGGTVLLELLGACGTCPMSIMTLKAGVEEAIKKFVPEIKEVQAINLTLPDEQAGEAPD